MVDLYKMAQKRNAEAASVPESKEPTSEQVRARMGLLGESFYEAREALRENAYGGKPPDGYADWGTYWKAR